MPTFHWLRTSDEDSIYDEGHEVCDDCGQIATCVHGSSLDNGPGGLNELAAQQMTEHVCATTRSA